MNLSSNLTLFSTNSYKALLKNTQAYIIKCIILKKRGPDKVENALFSSDQILLFESDFISPENNWFNVWVKQSEGVYNVWIEEWDPINNTENSVFYGGCDSENEAKHMCLELAKKLNKLVLSHS